MQRFIQGGACTCSSNAATLTSERRSIQDYLLTPTRDFELLELRYEYEYELRTITCTVGRESKRWEKKVKEVVLVK